MLRRNERLFFVLILIVLSSVSSTSFAQIIQPNRFEEEHKSSDHGYSIISLQEEGLFLVRENGKFEDGKKLWDVIHLDSLLNKKWSDKLKLEGRNNLVGYEYTPGHIYLLFRNGEAGLNDLVLLDFSLSTHDYLEYEIKHQFEFKLTHFSVTASTAIFGGYAIKEPAVLLYSMKEKQLKVVPGFLLHDTELLDLRVNHNNTFNVLMAERGTRDGKKIIVRTYDETGALLLEDAMAMEKDRTPLTGLTSALVKDELIVIGTYGIGNSKQSQGYYSTMIDPYSEQPVRYTDFTEFQHLLDYLGEKKATKVKQVAERQKKQGKPSTFRVSASLIRIQEVKKGFLLLSELYHASTTMNNSPYWGSYPYNYGYGGYPYGGYSPYGFSPYGYGNRYYNSPYSYSNSQNSEVRMFASVLVLFDEEAKPDWDESIAFGNIKYSSLEQTSDFVETPKGILMAYKKNSEIFTKYTVPYDDHALADTVKVDLPNEADFLKDESEHDGTLKHWYKNSFYIWGFQNIRDKSKQSGDPTRYVFYINKISTE
jgi:hypothetical protein